MNHPATAPPLSNAHLAPSTEGPRAPATTLEMTALRSPVVDPGRPAGVPSSPPLELPPPLLDSALPTTPVPQRGGALAVFVAFLVGTMVMGVAFGVYALGHRHGRSGDGSSASGSGLDIRAILDKAQPSVVTIQTGHRDSIFGGSGSGVVISADGLILTNAHVIEGAAGVITVRFNDGSTASAELVGAVTAQDVALIRADRGGLIPAELGVSADLRVGDDVVAIGNALNLGGDPSVTRGIVSALNRSISDGEVSLQNLIQTDAAINPGNSGGPLVNAQGRVVGINTAIIDGAQNVGFSIAIDSIKDLIPRLEAGEGDITGDTALLGVRTSTLDDSVTDEIREQYGITAQTGALIQGVEPESPAADGGLEVGDVVVGFGDSSVTSSEGLRALVRAAEPGDTVTITVERAGRRRSFEVTLGSN